MKILEAYYDLSIRSGMKRYLLAEGKKISEIDNLYRQFSTYLSRLKGITYYDTLLYCNDESEFRNKLNYLFDILWKGHMEYHEVPKYFIRYLHFLHSACALNPELKIDGIEIPEDATCVPETDFTDYAKPYLKNGKLMIIANPLLIKQLLPYRHNWPASKDEAINEAKKFYHSLLPKMNEEDWSQRIEELLQPKKTRKAKATARNVAFMFNDGSKRIMTGWDAMEFVVKDIGIQKCLTLNVSHKGDRLVIRMNQPNHTSSYKSLGNGLWLNTKGNTSDKVRTLRLVASVLRLPYQILLTNELPTEKS